MKTVKTIVRDQVVVINENQEKLETEELVWDEKNILYSQINMCLSRRPMKCYMAPVWRADETMTEYTILHPEGIIKIGIWTMLRLMKIFEVLWFAASLIALDHGIIRATSGQAYGNYIYITLYGSGSLIHVQIQETQTVCIWKSVKRTYQAAGGITKKHE